MCIRQLLPYQVVGTQGYAAPEYVETGHLKIQSDIWSFGVVLYEILTGRRVLNRNRPIGEQKLIEWVKNYPANSSRFSKIIDPRLKNQYSLGAARKVAKLADNCLKKNPEDRPSMSQIVESLKQALQDSETNTLSSIWLLNPLNLNWSRVVNRCSLRIIFVISLIHHHKAKSYTVFSMVLFGETFL